MRYCTYVGQPGVWFRFFWLLCLVIGKIILYPIKMRYSTPLFSQVYRLQLSQQWPATNKYQQNKCEPCPVRE